MAKRVYLLGFLFLCVSAANADVVYLKNGLKVEGEIQGQTDKLVSIVTPCGFQRLALAAIEGIIKSEPVAPADPKRKEAFDALQQGIALYAAEKWAEAGTSFEKAMAADPSLVEAILYAADVRRYHHKQPEKALELYQKAIQLDSKCYLAYFGQGVCFMDMAVHSEDSGKADEAIKAYKEALKLEPLYVPAHMRLMAAYLVKGDMASAAFHSGEGLRLDGNCEEAIRSLEQAVNVKPDNADAYGSLGIAYYLTKELEDAIENAEKALELGCKRGDVYSCLGSAFLYSKPPDYAKAVAAYEQAVTAYQSEKAAPRDLWIVFEGLGLAAGQGGDAAKALDSFRKSAEIASSMNPALLASSYFNLACAHAESQQKDKCCEALESCFKIEKQTGSNKWAKSAGKDDSIAKVIDDAKIKKLIDQYAGAADADLTPLAKKYSEERLYLWWSGKEKAFVVDTEAKAAGLASWDYRRNRPAADSSKKPDKPADPKTADKETRAKEAFEKAEKLELAKDYMAALKAYEKIAADFKGSDCAQKAAERAKNLRADPDVKKLLQDQKMDEDCKRWKQLAENYEKSGMKEKARETYKKIVDTYPASPYAAEAKKKLEQLK